MEYIANVLDIYFHISDRKSSIKKEFIGGVTTFLTMSYIIVVNPQTLSIMGIPTSDGVIGTALSAAVGSFIVGLFGNLPFGLCPGLGLTAYVAYGMVLSGSTTLSQAFTACLISGLLLTILSVLGATRFLLSLIPRSVRLATIVGMGLQIALAGMESVQLLVPKERIIIGLGPLDNFHVWLSFAGLIIIAAMVQKQIPGGILIGILILTVITWIAEGSYPSSVFSIPKREMKTSQLINFLDLSPGNIIAPIITFLLVGVIDVGGCVLGLGAVAGIVDSNKDHKKTKDNTINPEHSSHSMDDNDQRSIHSDRSSNSLGNANSRSKNGADSNNATTNEHTDAVSNISVPGALFAFVGCGVATVVGACLGTSPTIVVVESAVGIKVGARTGLSSCVVGSLFLFSLFCIPVLSHIPSTATAPVSMLLGVMMMSQVLLIDWNCLEDAVPAFLTIVMIPLTFSIANGIIIGIMAAVMMKILTTNNIRALCSEFITSLCTGNIPKFRLRKKSNRRLSKDSISREMEIVSNNGDIAEDNRVELGERIVSIDSENSRVATQVTALNTYHVFGNHMHSNPEQATAEELFHHTFDDIGLVSGHPAVALSSLPYIANSDDDCDINDDNDDNVHHILRRQRIALLPASRDEDEDNLNQV